MKTADVLISVCGDFILEYRPKGNAVSVTKILRDGSSHGVTVDKGVCGEKLRILCGMLWAARATPATAKEMAEDIEV